MNADGTWSDPNLDPENTDAVPADLTTDLTGSGEFGTGEFGAGGLPPGVGGQNAAPIVIKDPNAAAPAAPEPNPWDNDPVWLAYKAKKAEYDT